MTAPPHCRASTTALRSRHGTSGLFDKGFSGKEGFLSDTLNTPEVLKTIEASELFGTLGGEACMSLDGTGLGNLGDDVPLEDLYCSLLPAEDAAGSKDLSASGSSEFLEGFVDLASFMPEAGSMCGDVLEVSSADVKMECEQVSVKRSIAVAFPATEAPPPNPDHNDYTTKPKKPRYSTSDAETDVEGGASAPSTSKYIERRQKNNIASKRSRETRKQKFVLMEQQAVQLELNNAKLQAQVEELESLTKLMKSILVENLTKSM